MDKDYLDPLSIVRFKSAHKKIKYIRDKNIRNIHKREKQLSYIPFVDDCLGIIDILSNYDFEYKEKIHDKGKNMVFVVGLPRAGKSTLEKIAFSLDKFECFDELYSLSYMLSKIKGPDGILYKYPEYVPKMSDKIFYGMAEDFTNRLSKLTGDTDKIITNTMPGNFLYVPILKKMLPKCKIIWCHRQHSSHLVSLFSKRFKRSYWNFTDHSDELLQSFKAYYQVYNFYKSKIPNGFMDIQFENLIYSPETELQKILHYLEIEDVDTNQLINENKDYLNLLKFEDYRLKFYLPYLPEFLD